MSCHPQQQQLFGSVRTMGINNNCNKKERLIYLLVNVRPNFAKNGFLALKEIPRIGDVEEINLQLGFDGRLAPHFVRFASNFQD